MEFLPAVRFKLAWQTYSVGDVIQPNGALRDWLLANGYVELVADGAARQAEAETPARPGKLSRRAARRLQDDLIQGGSD